MSEFSLKDLDAILAERAAAPASSSYTASLIEAGVGKCSRKLGEEAVEAIIAAMSGDREELTKETADIFYHALVLLRVADVPLSDVMAELANRTGQSGLAEKASRSTAAG